MSETLRERLAGMDDVSIREFDGMTNEECEAAGLPTVEVQEFDGPSFRTPRFHKSRKGVITDRQLLQWLPVDRFPPPTETALWVAFEDPDQEEPVTELAEFSKFGRDERSWYLVGMSEPIDLRALYYAQVPELPRCVVDQAAP